jgi:quinohemoprotein ethanol dehydrogenase
VVNRGVAAYDGKIYVTSYDGRLFALDARTGNVV